MFPFAGIITSIEQLWSMIGVGTAMKSIVQQALSGTSLASMARELLSGDLVSVLEKTAEALFPKVAPELRLAAAVVAAYDHDKTKWVQRALNAILGLNIDVDGIYGPETVKAVEQFQQTQLGLKVDGWAYRMTNAAIQEVLNALLTKEAPKVPAPALSAVQAAVADKAQAPAVARAKEADTMQAPALAAPQVAA